MKLARRRRASGIPLFEGLAWLGVRGEGVELGVGGWGGMAGDGGGTRSGVPGSDDGWVVDVACSCVPASVGGGGGSAVGVGGVNGEGKV